MQFFKQVSFAVATSLAISMALFNNPVSAADDDKAAPVLVELFTSEGCSSCPPADALAISLQSRVKTGGSVIILGEHIDYWDHLGWKDPYSAPVYSTRQYQYANTLGLNVFTPQVVVDGVASATGNDRHAVERAISESRRGPKAKLTIALQDKTDTGAMVLITCQCPRELSGRRAQTYIAVSEDGIKTRVIRGENNGSTLAHTGVARSLEKLGSPVLLTASMSTSVSTTVAIAKNWKRSNLRIVAFLQDPKTLEVFGAQQLALE